MKRFFIALALVLAVAVPVTAVLARTPVYTSIPPVYCPQLSYNLYMGLSDYRTAGQVSALQNFLATRYGNQSVTGYFGWMTMANVARFQREQNVYPITGGVGPLTRQAIARVCGGTTPPPPPATTISAQPTSGMAPLTVVFTPTGIDTANQYVVEFGDGSNSGPIGGGIVAHTYTTPGMYTATLTRYAACLYSNPRCMIAVQSLGSVTVQVTAPTQVNDLSVTSPTAGQIYSRGSQMTISWNGLIRNTFAYEPQASIVDLYTAAGMKVGTIAISSGLSGSYQWSIPQYSPHMMCTMQYPNGLCGQNLQGQYYIMVTAVVGNGFGGGDAVIDTAQSGIFTIQ